MRWECNCGAPYPPGHKRMPCPIHKNQPLGDYVTEAFGHGLVKINYDGVSVYWRSAKDLWPPSIDAFHMVRHLAEDGYESLPARSICDLGCGTGFLGIWAGSKNRSHKHITFADWLLSPLLLSHGNVVHCSEATRFRPHYRLGLHDDWVNPPTRGSANRPDVVLCNPPYLPILSGFEDLLYDSTVAGTDLLEYVIENSHELADRVYVSFSSAATKEAEAAQQRGRKILRRLGDPEPVPFRVNHAFKRPDYIQALLDDNRITYQEDGLHPYWHTVSTFEVRSESESQPRAPA